MSKRKAVARGGFLKACAISLGVLAFANVATAQYANSADVYGYPIGLAVPLDHQLKDFFNAAMPDAQDAIFTYAELTPEQPTVETVIADRAMPVTPQAAIAPMPVVTPLPDHVASAAKPAAVVSTASTGTMQPTDAKPRRDRDEQAEVINTILQQYASKGINTDTAAALLNDVMNAKKDSPTQLANVTPAPATASTAASKVDTPAPVAVAAAPMAAPAAQAPVVQSWPFKPNATVQETLTAWARIAGWKTPKWEAAMPYRIVGGAPINGSFFEALRVVADALPQLDFVASVDRRELVISDAQH